MKKYLIFIICIILFSCKENEKENIEIMQNKVEKYFKDNAFKDNYELEIIELKNYGYDTLKESYIDTLKIISNARKIQNFSILAKNSLELALLKKQKAQLYSSLGDKTLTTIGKQDFEKVLKEANEYRDSIKKYTLIDSLFKIKVLKRKMNNDIYKAKFFIKATAIKNGEKENMLDSIYIHFDKKLNIIELNN